MKKENNIVLPIIFIVLLIIGIGVIIGDKVLENNNKEEQHYEEKQEVKEDIEEKVDISTPTLSKDKIEKDVKKYIKDEDYEVVSVYSKAIKELYEKYYYSEKVTNNYIEEKITNDMIILTALLEFSKENKIDYDNPDFFKNSEFYDRKYIYDETAIIGDGYDKIFYSNEKLDEYIKKLYGNDVKYDLAKYQHGDLFNDMNCCYYYYDEVEKKMFFSTLGGTGCGVDNSVETVLEYAYKKDNKLVIIEKSIFFGSEAKYNNAKKEKMLESYESYESYKNECSFNEAINNCFTKYKDDVSYYAYTYLKNENGEYYLADFSRLK